MQHLTIQQLEVLGFEIVRSYPCDEWVTQIRRKGNITIETTWLNSGAVVSQDVLLPSMEMKLSPEEIKKLDKIFNKK